MVNLVIEMLLELLTIALLTVRFVFLDNPDVMKMSSFQSGNNKYFSIKTDID